MGISVNLSTRFRVMKRDGYKCQMCGKTAQHGVELEVDHKVPVSKGGDNSDENLWVLCLNCNRGKSARGLIQPKDFNSEFYTTLDGGHRVLISCRDGFPAKYLRHICDILAEYIQNHAISYEQYDTCQIVSLFHNDTYGGIMIKVGSDNPKDQDACGDFSDILQSFFADCMINVDVIIVPKGNTQHDHYNHAEYIYKQVQKSDL